MKPKYYIPIIVILAVVITGIYFYTQRTTDTSSIRAYPTISDFNFYPIHELKQGNFTSGTYNTEGVVVKIYTCPPCPEGILCKPCMRDNIVISENNKILKTYSLTEHELIVFVENPKQFELGKKYKFTIRISDYNSTGEPINDVELVGYNLIE